MRSPRGSATAAAVIAVLAVACHLWMTGVARAAMEITVEGGRLSATLTDAPAKAVFERIAELGGFTLVLHPSFQAIPLSATVNDADLEEGVRQLIARLGPTSFVLEFVAEAEGDRLALVSILPFGEGKPPTETIAAPVERRLAPGQLKKFERWKADGERADSLPPGVAKKWIRDGLLPAEVIGSLSPDTRQKVEEAILRRELGSAP